MAEPLDPESQRIRGYLIAQAARLTIPELIEKVRTDSLQLWEAASEIPRNRLGERPGAEDWSAEEVLNHVLLMTENGVNAITGILSSGAVPPRITDTMLPGGRTGFASAADYRAAFEALRTPLYAVVSAAEGHEHPDVKITHPQFGGFTWREWFLFMRVHDLDHMRQLQSNAAAFNA